MSCAVQKNVARRILWWPLLQPSFKEYRISPTCHMRDTFELLECADHGSKVRIGRAALSQPVNSRWWHWIRGASYPIGARQCRQSRRTAHAVILLCTPPFTVFLYGVLDSLFLFYNALPGRM